MRILFIVHQFRPEYATGTETVIFNIAKSCQRAGHEVTVLTCALHEPSRWDKAPPDGLWFAAVEGVPVYAIPLAMVADPFALEAEADSAVRGRVRAFLAEQAFDVAHIGHMMRMAVAVEAVREADLPYVVTLTDFFPLCHAVNLMRVNGEVCDGPRGGYACATHCPGGPAPRRRFERFRRLLADAEARIACSDFVGQRYQQALPSLAIETLPHGVDTLRAVGRNAAATMGGGPRFGFLGTISGIKGPALLTQAFAAADIPDASLEIVGPVHGDMETAAAIRAVAAVHPNVSLRGAVAPDEVFDALARFDVLCLPSQVPETFSLVLHQAFACGVPALVSDLGAPAQLVTKHRCGWSVAHADVAAWTQALRHIAANPAALAEARSRVPLPLRLEEEAFFYEHLYRRAMHDHAGREWISEAGGGS